MKKLMFMILALGAMNAQAQENGKFKEQPWEVWQPSTGPGGIYFKARTAKSVYGLKTVAHGAYFAEVDDLSNMQQHVRTDKGQKYTFSFAYAHRKAAGDKKLKIYFNGEIAYDIFVASSSASGTFAYNDFEYEASGNNTVIGFQVVSLSGDPNKGVMIDDVALTTVSGGENLIAMGSFEVDPQRTARMNAGSYKIKATPVTKKRLTAANEDDFESLDAFTNYKIGKYLYHKTEKPARSLRNFELAKKGGFKGKDMNFYLARGYHLNHRFGRAVTHYQRYKDQLETSNANGKRRQHMVNDFIKNCIAGTTILPDSLALEIEALGKNVNSAYPDYVPLVSADESILVFTSRRNNSTGRKIDSDGKFYEDIYIATKNNQGVWGRPKQMDNTINTDLHDASIGLSPDGTQLFIYRDSNGGDIFMSKRRGQKWAKPVALEGDVNSESWEGSASITPDGKYLYFASNRPGGYGGIDIYRSKRMPNGKWGKAVNLGPQVNTAHNEEAPQIHTDQRTLFFSSKGHDGLGGFDIYSSIVSDADGNWSTPKNVGFPINTAGDDLHFSLAANGTKAYFNSAYFTSDNQNDLYVMKRPEASASLLHLRGKIVAKKNPGTAVEAVLTLVDKETNQSTTFQVSDLSENGYGFDLAFDTEYTLALETGGKVFENPAFKIDRRSDLFQEVMNFVVDDENLYRIVDRNLEQVASLKVDDSNLQARATDATQISLANKSR